MCFPIYVSDCVGELLNAFAICVGEVIVFSLKVIVLFLSCVVSSGSLHISDL